MNGSIDDILVEGVSSSFISNQCGFLFHHLFFNSTFLLFSSFGCPLPPLCLLHQPLATLCMIRSQAAKRQDCAKSSCEDLKLPAHHCQAGLTLIEIDTESVAVIPWHMYSCYSNWQCLTSMTKQLWIKTARQPLHLLTRSHGCECWGPDGCMFSRKDASELSTLDPSGTLKRSLVARTRLLHLTTSFISRSKLCANTWTASPSGRWRIGTIRPYRPTWHRTTRISYRMVRKARTHHSASSGARQPISSTRISCRRVGRVPTHH